MATILLRGRRIVGGTTEGEALFTHDTISGWGGIDPKTGTVVERRHQLCGRSFKAKILVFPGAKGSSGWSQYFHLSRMAGTAPKALLYCRTNSKVALGAVVTRAPAMTDFEEDLLSVIETGDWVRVDADAGFIEITRAATP